MNINKLLTVLKYIALIPAVIIIGSIGWTILLTIVHIIFV